MANDEANLPQRLRVFDRAVWMKWNKYALSGSLVILGGLIILALSFILSPQSYLLLGLGALVVLIGIIRLLIGFINPIAPTDLDAVEPSPDEKLDNVVFDPPPSEDDDAE